MLRISELTGLRVFVPKKPKTAKDGTVTERASKLGRVHRAVFSPNGTQVVGLMVKRPDVVGMVKRDDAFVAWDSFAVQDKEVWVRAEKGALDEPARRRLGLDWDACILWEGMDAQTEGGKPLGYVSDAEFDEKTGQVARFFTTDGGMAHALVGSFQITPDMVRGYANGRMVVDTQGRTLELDGGLAGAAGEGYARAKAGAAEVGKKAGAVAGKAVDKGSFALGRVIGKAKRAISDATEEEPEPLPQAAAVEAADVRVSEPVVPLPAGGAERAVGRAAKPAPKTYAPAPGTAAKPKTAAKKPAPAAHPAKKQSSTGDKVARAAGKQLSGMGKMFGSFAEEFKKASK